MNLQNVASLYLGEENKTIVFPGEENKAKTKTIVFPGSIAQFWPVKST